MKTVLWLLACILFLSCGCTTTSQDASATRHGPYPGEPALLWVDWAGAGESLSKPAIAREFCRAAAAAGFSHLGLEVRDPAGADLWSRQITLRNMAQEQGLRLAAVLSVFLADKSVDSGLLAQRANWNGEGYELITMSADGDTPGRRSPALETNQQRALKWIRDLALEPEVGLIILSELGFGDSMADLGPAARDRFASWMGISIRDWPEVVIGSSPAPLPYGDEGRGPLWSAWNGWRAIVMRGFLVDARAALLASPVSPAPRLAVLVDAPYIMHQRQGVNWAGPQAAPSDDFEWIPSGYSALSGSGHLLDAVILCLWAPGLATVEDAEKEGYAWWASARGAIAMAQRYAAPGCRVWGGVVMDDESDWEHPASAVKDFGEGLVILPASHYMSQPGRFSATRMILQHAN